MTALADLRTAARSLLRTPVLTIVIVLSLALGIGANTAIFSLLHQALVRTLPVADPSALVVLSSPRDLKSGSAEVSNAGGMEYVFSKRMFRELEKNPQGFTGLAARRLVSANLAFQGSTLSGPVVLVSGGYFPVLGLKPALGRLLSPADDTGRGNAVAVLSFGYWTGRLGGRTDILNRPLRVNGHVVTIVGVAPRGFTGITLGDHPDVFLPLALRESIVPGSADPERWDSYDLYVFGRLLPATTLPQARDALNSVYVGLVEQQALTLQGRDAEFMRRFRQGRLSFEPGASGLSQVRSMLRTPLLILLACTALVILIAAANAANLLLARAAQRGRELAIRAALGAGRARILRYLLGEAMLLAAAGGLAGLIVGQWVLDLLVSRLASDSPGLSTLSAALDPLALLFTLAVSLLTGLLFGFYPAWSASRSSVAGTLKEASSNASASLGGARVRKLLVTAQVAISVLLLIPMGLFLKSLVNLTRADLGIRTSNLIGFRVAPELNGYTPERSIRCFQSAEEQLAALPGVDGVAASLVPLISGDIWTSSLNVEGYPDGPGSNSNANFNYVGPGFFSQMGIPLLAGREFTEADTAASPRVAIVNQAWARHFFGDRNPIGRKFSRGRRSKDQTRFEIIGVVADTRYNDVRTPPSRITYWPYRQASDAGAITLYVRSSLPPSTLAPQIRRTIASLDPDLPVENLRTFDETVALNISSDRLVLTLASAFAVLATFLAMLGLYGVTAFGVTRRTREIGVRMALGAAGTRIRSLVFREVALILAAGIVVGVPAALALARLAESQLFGVQAFDPAVVLGAVAALLAAALLAGFIPAWRASRIDPLKALRYE